MNVYQITDIDWVTETEYYFVINGYKLNNSTRLKYPSGTKSGDTLIYLQKGK